MTLITSVSFMYVADITPEELFNMFFGGFGGATMSGGKKAFFTPRVYSILVYWL